MLEASIRVAGDDDAADRSMLRTLVGAAGRTPRFVSNAPADITYSSSPPGAGIWIPRIESRPLPLVGATQQVAGLTLLEPPVDIAAPIPGDLVRSARALVRDSFDSQHSEPVIEGYIAVLRTLLRERPPVGWRLTLLASGEGTSLLETIEEAALRGLVVTAVFGEPSRRRGRLARAVIASGGEVAIGGQSLSAGRVADHVRQLCDDSGAPVRVAHIAVPRSSEARMALADAGIQYLVPLRPGQGFAIARPFSIDDEPLLSIASMPNSPAALEAVRVAGGHTVYDLAHGRWALVDLALSRGAQIGRLAAAEPLTPGRLDGTTAIHITSVHRPRDVRIFHKEVAALRSAGSDARVFALPEPARRLARIAAGWRLVESARKAGADVYHVHDPELLPPALWLAWRSKRPVIYDAHEYLGETTKTKRWLPSRLRGPVAFAAERAERAMARRLDATVTANEDLAARFAAGGSRAVSVNNSPLASSFPDPAPPSGKQVLYVGGLGPLRGLPLMTTAFPLVQVEGAELVLVGPGDPGPLPPHVRHLGVVDHTQVESLLASSAVAWIPLQRHGNYDRAVPTKLVEAMAAGRPVVVSDLPRMAAIVRAARCGIVVAADDPVAHAAAISQLLGTPDEAAAMGAAGRAAFLANFAFEGQAAKLVNLYREVLR